MRQEDGSTTKVERSKVVEDEPTAQMLVAKVRRAIETGELYEIEAVRETPPVVSVGALLSGWLRAQAARKAARNTLEGYLGNSRRVLRVLQELHDLPADAPVPGTLLTREAVIGVTRRLQAEGLSEGTVYATVRALVAAWVWGCDDPVTYPGLSPAPRDTRAILPRQPVYTAAPAPTMAECDAVIRNLAERPRAGAVALPVSVIARCTGLRLGQVLALTVGDVSLSARTLRITTGKSRREKAEPREVPIAPALFDFLVPFVTRGESPESSLLRRRADAGLVRRGVRKGQPMAERRVRGGPEKALTSAWEAATEAGLVRREVWAPTNRRWARPDHAFRAAFQALLDDAGVKDSVIDYLVGHHPKTVRGKHYATPSLELQREAVALLPPIAWSEEEPEESDNVIPFIPR